MCAASPTSDDALGHEAARHREAERKGAAPAGDRDVAEVQAEALLQLGMKAGVVEPHDALGLGGALGPHDRRAVARQRQDRERAGGEEMLLGAAVMRPLMRHRGGDGGLAVRPADRLDAGALADARAGAVGGDHEPGAHDGAGGEPRRHAARVGFEVGDRGRLEGDARLPRLVDQRRQDVAVLHHVGERLARLHVAREGQKNRPHRVVELGVGDHHVEHRLGARRDRVPYAERLEQAARRRHDRRGARVVDRPTERRIGDRDTERLAERLAQRERERQPGKAGAADQHVNAILTVDHPSQPLRRLDRPVAAA